MEDSWSARAAMVSSKCLPDNFSALCLKFMEDPDSYSVLSMMLYCKKYFAERIPFVLLFLLRLRIQMEA